MYITSHQSAKNYCKLSLSNRSQQGRKHKHKMTRSRTQNSESRNDLSVQAGKAFIASISAVHTVTLAFCRLHFPCNILPLLSGPQHVFSALYPSPGSFLGDSRRLCYGLYCILFCLPLKLRLGVIKIHPFDPVTMHKPPCFSRPA